MPRDHWYFLRGYLWHNRPLSGEAIPCVLYVAFCAQKGTYKPVYSLCHWSITIFIACAGPSLLFLYLLIRLSSWILIADKSCLIRSISSLLETW